MKIAQGDGGRNERGHRAPSAGHRRRFAPLGAEGCGKKARVRR